MCADVKLNDGDCGIARAIPGKRGGNTFVELRMCHVFGANEVIELLRGEIAQF
jgi:hypothetical protein